MIRAATEGDVEAIIEVWLAASRQAHGFVAEGFWESHADDMREVYLPRAETMVGTSQGRVVGFVSLVGDDLAALFFDPLYQGHGIGAGLLARAKTLRSQLTLAAYVKNDRAVTFYRRHGFRVAHERTDEATGELEVVMTWASGGGSRGFGGGRLKEVDGGPEAGRTACRSSR